MRESGGETTETRVEDGKLLYERRWYHRGQSVSVEGRDLPKFPGHIHAITDEAVSPNCNVVSSSNQFYTWYIHILDVVV